MPTRQTRKKDPFQRIHSWDDGYEYVRDMPPPPPDSRNAPFYSPPLGTNRDYYEPEPPRRSKSRRDDEGYPRRAYPDDRDRDQPRRRQQSPPPYREARSPSPRRRDAWQPEPSSRHHQRRHSIDSRDAGPSRSRPTRSPSPPRHRHRDDGYRRSDRDLRDERDRPRDREHHDRERERRHTHSPPSDRPRHRHRSPSPPLKFSHTRHEGSDRPPLARSKTTTAAGAAHAAKERFDNLSPQWKSAAMAAFQAGSMAAISMRSQPGAWNGEKGAKIAKAALGAAAMGALKGDAGKKKSGGGGGSGGEGKKKSSAMDGIPGMVGGFLVDQLSKQREKKKH